MGAGGGAGLGERGSGRRPSGGLWVCPLAARNPAVAEQGGQCSIRPAREGRITSRFAASPSAASGQCCHSKTPGFSREIKTTESASRPAASCASADRRAAGPGPTWSWAPLGSCCGSGSGRLACAGHRARARPLLGCFFGWNPKPHITSNKASKKCCTKEVRQISPLFSSIL